MKNLSNSNTDTAMAVVNNVAKRKSKVRTEKILMACAIVEMYFDNPKEVVNRLQTDHKFYKRKLKQLYAEREKNKKRVA